MTPHQLIEEVAANGGSIVSSNDCIPMEITVAQACGRFYVTDEGLGVVLRPPTSISNTREVGKFDLCPTPAQQAKLNMILAWLELSKHSTTEWGG